MAFTFEDEYEIGSFVVAYRILVENTLFQTFWPGLKFFSFSLTNILKEIIIFDRSRDKE